MAIAAQHFQFQINGRINASDTDGDLVPSNLDSLVDSITVNGVDLDEADLDATALTALKSAIKTLITDHAGIEEE